MIRIITIGFLIVAATAFGVAGWNMPFVAVDEAQAAQNDVQRAAEEAEFGAERVREDDKQEIRDANEQAQRTLYLNREEAQRGEQAAETDRRRTQRKARLKALIAR